jgi:hypothetical protein
MVEETVGSLVHDRIRVNVFDCRCKRHGSSVAAVGIEQSRTEQKTRSEQSRFFGLDERHLITA